MAYFQPSVRGAQVHNLNPALCHLIPEPVEAQIKVLHATMVLRVLRHRERREVVDAQLGGGGDLIAKLSEQIAQPEHLLPT